MSVDPRVYVAFAAFVAAMLAVDLLVLHRRADAVPLRAAALSSALWVGLGLGFGLVLWWWQGPSQAGAYYAGYAIEKALSVDNVFVFALIFTALGTGRREQQRLLFWGIVGAIVLRAVLIAGGAAALDRFSFVAYLFGAFLVVTGVRLARRHGQADEPAVLRALRRRGLSAGSTALLAIVVADLVFALDSIPATFAVTTDPFVVLTANAFAVLGLRALYFLLAGSLTRFAYLHAGLAAVLVVVGLKMLVHGVVEVPVGISLAVVAAILGVAIGASLARERRYPGKHSRTVPSST
jgi:predicted tellurium resistance membrane protein TerC